MTDQDIIFWTAVLVPVARWGIRMLSKGLGEIAHYYLPPRMAKALTKERGEKQD